MTLYVKQRNRERDTDVENKCIHTKEEGMDRRRWEVVMDLYTLLMLCVKQTTERNTLSSPGNFT